VLGADGSVEQVGDRRSPTSARRAAARRAGSTSIARHELHHTVVHGTPVQPAWPSIGSPAEGFVHLLHWAGQPCIAARLVAAASGWTSRGPLTNASFT